MQLNVEQRRIISSKPGSHTLIKGVAGSGKTTVSVFRIPFLLNHYCFEKDDSILVVTYNKTLSNYIKYLYDKVDEEDKLDFQSIFAVDKGKVDIYTIDRVLAKYFFEYKKENNLKIEITSDKSIMYNVLNGCIAELKDKYSNVSVIEQKYSSFLLDEIDWIKSCNYMEAEEYQNADRLGRMSNSSPDGPQKLMKIS